MEHRYLTHDDCDLDLCHLCDGGLLVCTVCNGAESGLTSECCGRPLTDAEQYAVSCGDDFKNGVWVKPNIHA